ncbi:MAG: hypothetical protein SF162_03590 [bacterium]|nr:hypothetical protein [bacterium]
MSDIEPSGFAPLPQDITNEPYAQEQARKRRTRFAYNVLALLFLVGAGAVCAVYSSIWNDPFSALNPFPPDTPFPQVLTATPAMLPSVTPTTTRTPRPTATITQTPTPTTPAPTLTFTPISLEQLQLGTPDAPADPNTDAGEPAATPSAFALQNRVIYLTNPDGRGGCRWSSITGTVTDGSGGAIIGYGVRVVGGDGIDQTVATGSVPSAGPGGFEMLLGTVAVDAEYTVQLIDPSGNPVSQAYPVSTRSDCAFNIAVVRFQAAP